MADYLKSTAEYSDFDKKVAKLPKTNKKTLVFDLDETLIHCSENGDT
jgi:CTD small phosphatase-like protein 2